MGVLHILIDPTMTNHFINANIELPEHDLWVFGYGSLMWNPGFAYTESRPARIFGFHRRLCLWSKQYRGTPEKPGLVLGLAAGGSCNGMAFRLHDQNRNPHLNYLYEREMINDAYQPVVKPVYLEDDRVVTALTFVSKTKHPQFAPEMPIEQAIKVIKYACGPSGTNIDYIINTVSHLDSIGIRDPGLHRIADILSSTCSTNSQPQTQTKSP